MKLKSVLITLSITQIILVGVLIITCILLSDVDNVEFDNNTQLWIDTQIESLKTRIDSMTNKVDGARNDINQKLESLSTALSKLNTTITAEEAAKLRRILAHLDEILRNYFPPDDQ